MEAQLGSLEALGHAFQLTVTSVRDGAEVASYVVGERPAGDASYVRTLLGDTDAVRCRCEIWSLPAATTQRADPNELAGLIEEMIKRHWGGRDPHTMLPYLKNAGSPAQFAATVRSFKASPVAVLHTDLDKFKAINDEVTEVGGNKVLAEFARRFRLAFAELGVTVRTGGDEFSAILDLSDPTATIMATDAFRRQMEEEPFEAIGRTNTCSVGLCLYEDGGKFADAKNEDLILEDARAAEVRAKNEGRNRICLVGPRPTAKPLTPRVEIDDLRETALAARRSAQTKNRETVSAFKAAVRSRLRDEFTRAASIEEAMRLVRDGLGLLIGSYAAPLDRSAALAGVLDSLDWAGMVASALFEATYEGSNVLAPDDTLELIVEADGALGLGISGRVLSLDCTVQSGERLRAGMGRPLYPVGRAPIGAVQRLALAADETAADHLSPVLLLPIGDEAKAIADELTHLAAAVVDVDDRPARGGGLPDFWQSNLSRVIRAALANPNIGFVLAIGDEKFAPLTMARLRAGNELNFDELQRRLSMNMADLSAFRDRGLTIATATANRSEVLRAIEEITTTLAPLSFESRTAIDQLQRSRRRLAIARPNPTHRLDIMDGLRTKTLADAYPEALQLIRGAPDDYNQQEPRRGLFREATGFKVILTDPLNDRVPDYWAADSERLEGYYSETFKAPSGAFGRRLSKGWNTGATSLNDFAVTQTVDAATKRVPTRRINIPILPDELEHPLGLSSIQVMPRIHAGVGTLDTIFVWRTVDALVGFPFSAYGSIRWSQDFLEAVNAKLGAEAVAGRLRMGTLTYIALSFHMYLHDGDVEIARTIVQDASF